MKSIYELYESVLDDDFEDNSSHIVAQDIVGKESAWRVCKDGKHLRYAGTISSLPKVTGYKFIGNFTSDNETTIKDAKTISKAGLEFLPLCYFDVDVPMSQDLLYEIPCPWTANAYIRWEPDSVLNFDKVKMECKSISIWFGSGSSVDKPSLLIAPKYHTDYLCILSTGPDETISPGVIRDWDCDLLVIKCANRWHKSVGAWVHGDPMQQFHREMVQELIDNNPKAKDIYIAGPYGDNFLYKCVCKKEKGKRVVTKMTPYKIQTIERKMDNYTSWCSKSLEIHHEYEIKDKR